jgi:polyisoprenoid-binding protein YceI
MASRFLRAFGLFALLALFGASIALLVLVKGRVRVTVAPDESEAGRAPPPWASTQEEIAAVRADLRAFAAALGPQLEELAASLDAAAVERERALRAELAGARADVAALRGELAQLAAAVEAPAPALAEEPPAPAAPPPAPRKKGFLRFELPSDAFAFDRRQRLALLPSLSRVGFDAKSTLHDFSGATSKVEGELTVNLAAPVRDVAGLVVVDAAALSTDLEARDEKMREHLATASHPQLSFEWTAFRAESIDAERQLVRGAAKGTLSIRGVAREVEMPVAVSVDASKRVVIEGALPIKLSDFAIPIPSQLGVIGMEDPLTIWIALRARAIGAAEEVR